MADYQAAEREAGFTVVGEREASFTFGAIYRDGVTWKRCEGRAIADGDLGEEARDAQLEDYIRMRNPQLTDIRLAAATPLDETDNGAQPPRRWYHVVYLAND